MRPLSRRLPCLNPQQRRTIYGYEQAKALIFKDHGEPKDVLRYHISHADLLLSTAIL